MALVLASAAALALGSGGCETTREQAAKVSKQGDNAFRQTGLDVGAANRAVSVVETAVISDVNGSAVVAVLRNTGPRALSDVPLQLVVRDGRGRATARNDEAGLEHWLTHVALLPPGREVVWVNDQLTVLGGRPARADLTAGRGRDAPANASDVKITVADARLEGDVASGLTAVAKVVNGSAVPQRELVIASVARRGGRVVAAGRAIVPLLRARGRATIHVYYIGDPTGAELTFESQPSTLP
ncbi:hypothetical protein [Conexibacter sp. CPCC 206217]|uniref:hypothetical protein n=1 Tax=Conexibacter sp. CPCC 206217 TaxID=3064574 RepID=UPI0027248C06|nr:hypothetical protein [Conexibacter sp. CPCC 206217]MDO8212954.1 hypothetical protein [Conexibacter sp. CPCC 206217]